MAVKIPNLLTDCVCHGAGVRINLDDRHEITRCPCGARMRGSWIRHRTYHRQVYVTAGGRAAAIDEQLASLIHEAWAKGIWTFSSCQGGQINETDSWPGTVVVLDPERVEELIKLWGWDKPGLYFHDTLSWEGAWEMSMARLRFDSIEGVKATQAAYQAGCFTQT